MGRHLFICHSSQDEPRPREVCEALEQAGHTCWYAPRELEPTAEWAGKITEAIRQSALLVLIFSANSNQSPQVLNEVNRAVNCRVPIVVFRVENTPPSDSLEYYLGPHQWLNVHDRPWPEGLDELRRVCSAALAGEKRRAREARHRRRLWTAIASVLAAALLGFGAWKAFMPPEENLESNSGAPAAAPEPFEVAALTAARPPTASLELGSGIELEFVLVKPGEFEMGSNEKEARPDERPAHRVRVARSFYLAKYPTTVAQFRRFAEATSHVTSAEKAGAGYGVQNGTMAEQPGFSWKNPGFSQGEDHPVVLVSREDALEFANWVSRRAAVKARLPTEMEWEFAARGPESRKFPWGPDWNGVLANHADLSLKESGYVNATWQHSTDRDGHPHTSASGALPNASFCGARDMAGNVWQWCDNLYSGDGYIPSPKPSSMHAIRGGSWTDLPAYCRASARYCRASNGSSVYLGFRVLLDPPQTAP